MSQPLRFIIPSEYTEARRVQHAIMEQVAACRYGEEAVFAISIALEEALINAMKHGNKLDPGKTVTVEAVVTAEKCEISIEDQGPGFKRSSVPDPTADENLEKLSGRGILLIEAYMSEVEWSNDGRRLKMTRLNDQASAHRP